MSIAVPVLNEEKLLPSLPESIKRQAFKDCGVIDYEVIIVDGSSSDETVEIAKSFGCRVIELGFTRGPVMGRDRRVKVVRGDLILFLDADTELSDSLLRKLLKGSRERNLDVTSFCFN